MTSNKPFQTTNHKILIFSIALATLFVFIRFLTVYAAGPVLEITKEFADGSTSLNVESGQTFTFRIRYRCASILQDCSGVQITDAIPSELQYISADGPISDISNISYSAGTVTFDFVEPLGAGTTGVLEIRAQFKPGTLNGVTAVNEAVSVTSGGSITSNQVTATVVGSTFEMYANKAGASQLVYGHETSYALQVCSPDTVGGVRLTNPEMQDPLPPTLTFVSASHGGVYDPVTHTIDWTYASNGGGLPDIVEVTSGCGLNVNVTVRVDPDGPDGSPATGDEPAIGDNIVNNFIVWGNPEDGSPQYSDGQGVSGTVIVPTYSDGIGKTVSTPSSYLGNEELPGGPVNYTVSYNNSGFIDGTNLVLTDTIPAEIDLTSIQMTPASAPGDPINGYYEVAGAPGTWTPFPGNPYASSTNVSVVFGSTPATDDIELTTGDRISGIRWEIGNVNAGGSWSSQVNGTIDAATPVGVTFNNCLDYTAAHVDFYGLPGNTNGNSCVGVTTIDPRAIPIVGKSASNGSLQPGEVAEFTLSIENHAKAQNPVLAPMSLIDMMPAEYEIVVADAGEPSGYRVPTPAEMSGDLWFTMNSTDGAPTPTTTVTPNFSGTDTLLRWEWFAPYEQDPGNSITIRFYGRVVRGTPPGPATNAAYILRSPATVNPIQCTGGGTDYDDTLLDLDGNPATVDGCEFSTNVTVEPFLSMDSQKFVWGQLDTGWNDYGYTVAGGDVDYRIVITNTGNITATNIVVYDILPYVGDTGVVDTQSRGSTWRPNLQAPIVNTSGLPVTISYSQQQNPCRPEVMPSGPAGCVDDWSTTPPADITSVQSIRLEFCNGGTCAELGPDNGTGNGGSLEFTWHMVAPNDAPQNVPAWNSFGYTAESLTYGLQLLPSEPIRVGIELQQNTLPGVSLGDYVWLDVYGDQDDGIQHPLELGVNGVRVELWDNNGGLPIFVDYRVTGVDANGDDGFYQFVEVPAGDYFVRFFPPAGYTVSPPNTTINDLDSDGESVGTDPTYGDYWQTAVFTVTPDSDPLVTTDDDWTWDQGIWLPTDYGDAPNNYPTESASLGANPELAARHIISPTMYMGTGVDAELDGQPDVNAWGDDNNDGNDDEDGVTFPAYLGTLANPSGILIRGENNTLTIDTTAPVTSPGYLNAWIDYNADGDWDDAGEQIATDLAMSGGSEPLVVNVPGTAVLAKTYARFRFSTQTGLLPTGTAINGEVEDYQVQIVPRPVKSIIDTSEAHTTGTGRVAIGEIIRYRLEVTVPEGTMTNFTIDDNLPGGLLFLDDNTTIVSTTADTSITIANNPPNITPVTFSNGTDPIFDLGTVINNDNDLNAEQVILEFNALVLNNPGSNDAGDRRRNNFDVSYNNYTDLSNNVDTWIAEPVITIAKSVTTAPTDAGDTLVYEIVATAGTGTYRTTAFDVNISDLLDADLTLGSVSISEPAYATATDNSNISGNSVDVDFDELRPGDSVTVTITATVKSTAQSGETIPNVANLTYTSLPGPQGTTGNSTGSDTPDNSGDDNGERNGSGTPTNNDYNDTDNVDVNLADPAMVKSVTPTDYTIGEQITFDVVVTLPEGVTRDAVVTDNLPVGLEYVSYQVIGTAAGSGGLLAADFNGALPVPTDNTPVTGSGSDLALTFGDITTTGDNVTNNNSFLVRVTAVVLDILGNQNGDTLTNTAILAYTKNGSTAQINDSTNVNLIEPVLMIDKSLVSPIPSPLDAGTVITYQVVLQHDATTAADAYDVVITDTLPSELFNGTLIGVTASGIANPGGSLVGDVLRVPAAGTFDLPQGAVVTATFSAEIGGTAVPGQTITNNAGAVWTTLDNSPPEERHGGSTDPDGSDFLNGGAVDDYEIEDPASFNVDGPSFVKALQTTSAGHTTGSNVTIGEIVTYSMTVTLAEGTIPSLRVVDNLPAGMAYVSGSLTINDAGFSGTLPAESVTAPGGSGGDVTIDWTSFTLPADNDPGNNSFIVEIDAVVMDVAGNVGLNPPGQTVLTNTATVQVGSNTPESSNPVDVTVVEPQMEISKNFSTTEASPNETVMVTLVVTNTGTSTAYDVTIEDPLPVLTYTNVTEGSTPGSFAYSLVPSGSNNIVTYTGGPIAPGGTATFTYNVTLHSALPPSPPDLLNVATVTQATTLDSGSSDGDDTQERDEPDVNDGDTLTVIIPDLLLTKTNGITYVSDGDLITYTITVENVGGADATGVVITETVPANTTFDLANSTATWTGCADNAAAGTTCVFTVGNLNSGDSTSVQFAVEVDDPLPNLTATIANTAVTADDGTHGIDPTPSNNTDPHQDTVLASIGDYVWEDMDADGIQNDGSTGINGVTVNLYRDVDGDGIAEPGGDDGAVISTTLTVNDGGGNPGYYLFDRLIPDDYFIEFVKPAGFEESPQDVGADTTDSDPVITTGVTPVTTLTAGEKDMTWDAGFFRPVSIGSFVWEDQNNDGTQGAAEPGIAGATVALLVDNGGWVTAVDANGSNVANQTTGADGLYNFTNLPPGNYRVRVTPPADFLPSDTQTAADDDNTASDSNIADEPVAGTFESGTFTLTIDGEPTEAGSYDGDNQDDSTELNGNMTVDFGFFQPLSIGSFVWIDQDGDGIQDASEPGIVTATVELLVDSGGGIFVPAVDVTGTAVLSQTTGTDGLYNFTNLPPGDYKVRVTPPASYLPSLTQNNLDDDITVDDSNIKSEPVAGTYESGIFTLVGSSEPTESGSYDGDAQDDSRDNDGNMTVDFGFIEPVSLGSFVWEDYNGDGRQDGSEPGITGATVALFVRNGGSFVAATDVNGTAVPTQTTGADGLYHFTNLPPGSYRVQVTPPAGYSPSLTQTTADDDNNESDSNIASDLGSGVYESGTFTLTVNGEPTETNTYDGDNQDDSSETNGNMTVDFGFIQAVSIGSFVWEDQDSDGLQDIGEPGLAGATVALLFDGGSGFVAAADVMGVPVPTQTTTTSGEYLFTNLPPGDYRVQVTPPADYTPTPTQNGADNDDTENDSNIAAEPVAGTFESGTFTLNLSGEPDESETYVGDDQDDVAETDGNMTVDFGFVPVVTLGSFVWIDQDGNGLQDVGEPGIPGADVALFVDNGSGFVLAVTVTGTAVLNQTTGADGLYHFINLPPGDYRVQVTPPSQYMPTLPQTTTDNDDTANDSNIADQPVAGTYESGTFTLATGGEPVEAGSYDGDDQDDASDNSGNMTVDFGFIEPVSIGSFIWEDIDYSGTQDGGELGIAGITVTLWVDNGSGFVPATDVNGVPVLTQTTTVTGQYFFDNLPPGDYRVQVTPPSKFVPTPNQTTVNNDGTEDDSNIATEPVTGTYETGTFTLTVDGEPTETGTFDGDDRDDTADNDGNMTIDFGFVQPVSIGSFVWEDLDSNGAQDAAEPGIAGAVVALLFDSGSGFVAATDVNGVPVPTQTTTTDGQYFFDNLPPGTYRVQVTPPSEYVPTPTQTTANDNDTESDSNIASEPTAGTYESGSFTLTVAGEPTESGTYDGDTQDDAVADDNGNMTVDFGFVPVVSIGSVVWEDLDGDGVQEAGEPGIAGATLTLWVDNGSGTYIPATDVYGTAVSSQLTAADGQYFFNNLPEGDYKVRVTPPAGYTPTRNQESANNNDTENDSNLADDLGGGVYESGVFTLTRDGEPVESNGRAGDDQDDTVGAYTDDNNGNMTVDFGFYQPVAVGNVVWVDDGLGGGTVNNGILDGTEAGVPGVQMELYWATDTPGVDTPYATTTTNSSGEYLFDMIPQGNYIVHIPANQFVYGAPLSSFISSTGNGGDDGIDDDANENGIDNADPTMNGISSDSIALAVGVEPTGETGQGSYPGTLVDADVNMTVDFGFFELLTLGNRVWYDADNDAMIGGAESGAVGVVLNLLDAVGDPLLNPITGLPITTTTDVNGYYQFTHLYPGDYIVQVAPENFQPGGVLENFLSSTGSIDPDNDADSDDNGNDSANLTVDGIASDPVTLNYDLEPDNNLDTDDNNNTNLSVDFGVYLDPTAVTLISFTATKMQDKVVQIQWRTGTEIDNYGFKLYRSDENVFGTAVQIHFESSGIPGGSGMGTSYQYEDTVPANGTWYYWLVDVDTHGQSSAAYGPVSVSVSPLYQIFIPMIIR